MSDQLARLARPYPRRYVAQVNAGGGLQADYVKHSVGAEALLAIVGPFDWHVTPVHGKDGAIVGALGRLTVTIDGRETSVTEVGDTTGQENDEGGALKNAASDALKRAAMRLGLGLHLWSGLDNYFLFKQLT